MGPISQHLERDAMPGKRVQFDDETWHTLDLLARDRMQDFQELADEAFRDLLQKHGRTTDLKTALRKSADTGRGPARTRKNADAEVKRRGKSTANADAEGAAAMPFDQLNGADDE
jgi:hypothetical protein